MITCSFIQQGFIECVLWIRHLSRHWRVSHEMVSIFLEFTFHGVLFLVLLRVPAWAHVSSAQKSGNGQRGHSGISNHGKNGELKWPFRPSGHLSKAESEKVPSQAFWGRWRVTRKRVLYPEMGTQALMTQSRTLSRLQRFCLNNKASNHFQTRIGWYSCLTLEMLSLWGFLETLPNQCGEGSIREQRGLGSPSCKQIRGTVESRKKTVHKLRKQGPLGCEVTGEIEAMGTTRALLWNFQDGAQKTFID